MRKLLSQRRSYLQDAPQSLWHHLSQSLKPTHPDSQAVISKYDTQKLHLFQNNKKEDTVLLTHKGHQRSKSLIRPLIGSQTIARCATIASKTWLIQREETTSLFFFHRFQNKTKGTLPSGQKKLYKICCQIYKQNSTYPLHQRKRIP